MLGDDRSDPESADPGDTRPWAAPGRRLERVGPYRILGVLGEGGMGTVYLAEQTEPLHREVALKVIRPGMGSREIVARFESERRALAVMEHPNIAHVYDAGTSESGQPYFVMERVDGQPITRSCDEAGLGVRQRVELFLDICEAVQHAHHKGVIHRDLKPSNILVAPAHGAARAKIIDFGIAKAVGGGDDDPVTRAGALLGTPEYMSPEQAGFSDVDVDARTDVHSLGVVLYELLSGATPRQLSGLSDAAVRRALSEGDPPTPSQRFDSLGAARREVARHRRTDPDTLRRQLAGDLGWIVMKAVERERDRRYQTPNALAADLRSYLAHRPVTARPVSRLYYARRFVRRNRIAVGAAAAVLLALVAGAGAAALGLRESRRSERRAQQEADKAIAVTDFIQGTLLMADPFDGPGRDVTVVEALDTAVARLGANPLESPEIDAAVRQAIGLAYLKLGRYDDAEALLRSALATQERVLEPQHADIARTAHDLASLRFELGDFAAADSFYSRVIDLTRRASGNPPLLAHALKGLGMTRLQAGDPDGANTLLREALSIREREASDSLAIAELWSYLGLAASHRGRDGEAERGWRRALELRRRHLGDDHPFVAELLNNLANLLENRGEYEDAEPMYREALAVQERHLGEEHPQIVPFIANLGLLLDRMGKDDEAERLLERALALDRRYLGGEHLYVALDLANLGDFLCDNRNRPDSARQHFDEGIRILENAVAPEDFRLASVRSMYGSCLTKLSAYELAEAQLLSAAGALEATVGADHWRTRRARSHLVELYEAWGRPDRASAQRALLEDQP